MVSTQVLHAQVQQASHNLIAFVHDCLDGSQDCSDEACGVEEMRIVGDGVNWGVLEVLLLVLLLLLLLVPLVCCRFPPPSCDHCTASSREECAGTGSSIPHMR